MGQGQVKARSKEQGARSEEQLIVSRAQSAVSKIGNRKSPSGDLGAECSSPWLVVRTKIKCEKFVRDRLQMMGMEAFVPLRKRTARYNRKVVTYEHPLISCYTFVRFDRDRRNDVLALPYVQGMLRIDNKDCHVSEREMEWLQKVSGLNLNMRTEILSLHVGERVVLACGQLAGMEGTIVSNFSKHEVVVALDSLGLQMVIQVDPGMLERIDYDVFSNHPEEDEPRNKIKF